MNGLNIVAGIIGVKYYLWINILFLFLDRSAVKLFRCVDINNRIFPLESNVHHLRKKVDRKHSWPFCMNWKFVSILQLNQIDLYCIKNCVAFVKKRTTFQRVPKMSILCFRLPQNWYFVSLPNEIKKQGRGKLRIWIFEIKCFSHFMVIR